MKIEKKRDETKTRAQTLQAERRTAPIIRVRSNLRAGVSESLQPIEPICC